MMKPSLIAFLVACAACGGSSSRPSTPAPMDPVPMAEPVPVASVSSPPPAPVPETTPAPASQTPAAPSPETIKANLLATEMAAYERAKPVFDEYCASCHSTDGARQTAKKRAHFDMSTYPFGGHHAMEVHDEIRGALGLTGKKPTMPADRKGAVKGDDLARIAAWADAFEASHEGGAHTGHDGHATGHGGHGGHTPPADTARAPARKRPAPRHAEPKGPAPQAGGEGGHGAHGAHGHDAHGGHNH